MIHLALQLWSDWQRRSAARVVIGVAVGVLGMVLGVLLPTTQFFKQSARDGRLRIASARLTSHTGWVQVGHLTYTILAARLQHLPDSKNPEKKHCLAHVTVRVADIQGVSDYIDNETFRLLVDGQALSHSNNVNLTVYEQSAVQAELVFELPAATASAELMVGRPSEGMARIPLEFIPRRMADGR